MHEFAKQREQAKREQRDFFINGLLCAGLLFACMYAFAYALQSA